MSENVMLGIMLTCLAAQFRDVLGDLSAADRELTPPQKRLSSAKTDRLAAYAERGRVRMLRMTQNMETYGDLLLNPSCKRSSCDIVELMSELCEGAADLAAMMGIRLSFSCSLEEYICALHPVYIQRCLGNLLSNALKNTPGGGYVKMGFLHSSAERQIVLTTEDNGNGIPPEKIPTLFDRDWSDPELLRNPLNASLGLPLCKLVAQAHGGALNVESKPGQGAKFTLRIPDGLAEVTPRQDSFYEPEGLINPVMTMLSDALPWQAFTVKNLL